MVQFQLDLPVVLAAALDPWFRKLTFRTTEQWLEQKSVMMEKAVDCDGDVVLAPASGPLAKKEKSVYLVMMAKQTPL